MDGQHNITFGAVWPGLSGTRRWLAGPGLAGRAMVKETSGRATLNPVRRLLSNG